MKKYTMTPREFFKEAFPKAEKIYLWVMIAPGRARRCASVSRREASLLVKSKDDQIYARLDKEKNLHIGIPPFWDLIIDGKI